MIINEEITETNLLDLQRYNLLGKVLDYIIHDFNNAVSVISGNLLLLEQNQLKEDEIVESIKRGSLDITKLVDELELFSSLKTTSNSEICLNKILARIENISKKIKKDKVELNIVNLESELLVEINSKLLFQLIFNLLLNSYESIEEKGLIKIIAEKIELKNDIKYIELDDKNIVENSKNIPYGNYSVLKIKDNGKGIPEKIFNQIFKPFFTTSKNNRGLGLCAVYEIAKKVGAYLNIKTTENVGTEVSVFFPMKERKLNQENTTQVEKNIVGKNIKVVCIEDDETILKVIEKIMKINGFEFYAASNVKESLLIFESLKDGVDVVITDILLPKSNGVELVARLKEHHPSLKVIFISGYYNPESFDIIEDENTVFLKKPFRPSVLVDIIKDMF